MFAGGTLDLKRAKIVEKRVVTGQTGQLQRRPFHFRIGTGKVLTMAGLIGHRGQERWVVFPPHFGQEHGLLEIGSDFFHVFDLQIDLIFGVLQDFDSVVVGGVAQVGLINAAT